MGQRLERRLQALEAKEANDGSGWTIPIEARVLMTAVARCHGLEDGKRPPRHAQEEIAHLRESDLEDAAGGGVVGQLRDSPGWQSEEARELLDSWEEGARRRLKSSEGLPPERWHEAYERDGDEGPGVVGM
jgi:hypothetical protein